MAEKSEKLEKVCNACELGEISARNVENTGKNLCDDCKIDYQINWRAKYSPIQPNVELFILWKQGKAPGLKPYD